MARGATGRSEAAIFPMRELMRSGPKTRTPLDTIVAS